MSEILSGRDGTILLVEADVSRRSRMEQALSGGKLLFDLVIAATAGDAISLLSASASDLVLAARILPDASGQDLARRIHDVHPHLQVWLVDADGEQLATLEGADDYLDQEPVSWARLPHLAARAVVDCRAGRSHDGHDGNDGPVRPGAPGDLASMVHDLRSPLAGAVALIELLAGEIDGSLNDAQKARVARLRGALERLTGVVDGMADLAQAESGRLVLARGPLDLGDAARGARQQLDALLRSRAISLELALPSDLPPLMGDPQRVRQLIISLVTGMARQLEGTTLEMAAAVRGAMIQVTLREAARGLPVEALPPAFDQSPTAVAETASVLGVSLSLARALTALHGGSLRIGRDQDGGLIASLSLPAAQSETRTRPERPSDLRTTT